MKQEKILELLKDMSLEEKIDQLLQLGANYFKEGAVLTGPEAEIGITEEEIGRCGSVLSLYGAENIKKAQDRIMKQQPHHIPALFMYDVIHGLKTINPVPIALGCTYNEKLIKEGAAMNAKEAAVSGLHVVFSPMSDLCRDPRWGRVVEGTGEDKYLNSVCTKAMVEGFQGETPKEKYKVGACVKHFAAYGRPEAGRDYSAVELSNRTLLEDYLPAYEAGVEAGAVAVMTSFNTIDRIPSTANQWLMRKILREKMGFQGVLISDYGAIAELMEHGIAKEQKDAAKLAMQAGVDIDMMSNCYVRGINDLVKNNELKEELVDEAVLRILMLKNELGLFENPYKDASEQEEKEVILSKENRLVARKAAEESFVLLENDGILPLKTNGQKIAWIGPYAEMKELHGAWALDARGEDSMAVSEVVSDRYPENEYVFEQGCNIVPKDSLISGLGSVLKVTFETKEEEDMAMERAVESAASSDVVVMMLGEHRLQTGEAASVAEITLPKKQLELLDRVSKVNNNIVVVLFNGRPLDLRYVKERANAILEAWFPGTEGAIAIADTLFGVVNPSGKLSMSFPYCVGQVPVHYDEFHTGRLKQSEDVKFCSRYEDIPNQPLYPFGYGLSYSEFTYTNRMLSKTTLKKEGEDSIEASVLVTNCSDIDGKEVVELYIQDVKGSVVRPMRELKGFQKIFLKAGEGKRVSFTITSDDLRFYDINMEYKSEPGAFRVYIGKDSRETCALEFELTK